MAEIITQDAVDHLELLVREYGIKGILDALAETCENMAEENDAQSTGWHHVADKVGTVGKSPFVARLA